MEYLRFLLTGNRLSEDNEQVKRPKEEGIYYTRDNLMNFYIKVVLRKVTASATQTGILRDTGRSSRASNTGDQDTEEWVFKWQEKVFSQHEDELFADANNCVTALDDQYHREVLRLRGEGCRPNGRLFCYVDSDQHKLKEETVLTCKSPPTFYGRYGSSVRRRHVTKKSQHLSKSVIRDPVLYSPSHEQRVSHRINTPHSQTMFLMADLRKKDGIDYVDEHLLCQIKIDSHGRVTIKPDFTKDKPANRIENRHKEVFEYRLEAASDDISLEEEFKEQKVQCELYTRHANYLKSCVGDTFSNPPEEDALRVQLHGEIVSAKGFEYDDLYVKTQLELPEFWHLSEDVDDLSNPNLSVVSQISRTKSRHLYNIAYFGCPFEFYLLYNSALEIYHLPKWPRLLIEVSSLDFWERHRIEGYGYMDVPNTPGSYDIIVNTWRPSGNGLVDQMRRFFIGGAPEISETSYISCPRDFQGDHLSRYGFQTVSSGSVKIHVDVLHQSSLFVKSSQKETAQSAITNDFKGTQATLGALWSAKKRASMVTAHGRPK